LKARGVFLIAIHLITLISTACGEGKLNLIVQESIPAPDADVVADWYSLSGGGAAGFSTDRVRLRRATDAFVADNGCVFSAISGHTMKVKWIGKKQLEISYDKSFGVRRSSRSWGM
jgi:hypothetical protein